MCFQKFVKFGREILKFLNCFLVVLKVSQILGCLVLGFL